MNFFKKIFGLAVGVCAASMIVPGEKTEKAAFSLAQRIRKFNEKKPHACQAPIPQVAQPDLSNFDTLKQAIKGLEGSDTVEREKTPDTTTYFADLGSGAHVSATWFASSDTWAALNTYPQKEIVKNWADEDAKIIGPMLRAIYSQSPSLRKGA